MKLKRKGKISIVVFVLIMASGAIYAGTKPIEYVQGKMSTEIVDERDAIQKVTDNLAVMTRRELEQGEKVKVLQKELEIQLGIYKRYGDETAKAVEAFNLFYAGI